MGPFPFINFEQAEINGNFGDEYAYRKVQLQTLVSLFVDDYFLGDRFFVSVNEIRNEVELLNQAPTFASLELVLPSPYPTSTGVEVYTLRVEIQQNNECFIEIVFNITDGIVTSSDTIFTPGPDLIDSATNRPFIDEELKIAKTLSVYNQNGAAIFPDTFTYNPTTGIAERRLLRAYDWEYNTTTNRPQRDGITDLRMIPKTVFRLRELTQIEKAMATFFLEKPIKESITNDDWNDTNIYLNPLPEGWTFSFISHTSVQKQLSIVKENQIALILAGRKVSGNWYFQRFIDPFYTTGALPNIAAILMGSLPASPNNGKLYNPGSSINFYDYDQCEFGTVVNEEPFNLIIKSADNYQINIATDFIFDPAIDPESAEAPRIGIFDCNGQYLQDIGSLEPKNLTFSFNLPFEFEISCNPRILSLFDGTISYLDKVYGYSQVFDNPPNPLSLLNDIVSTLTIGTASFTETSTGYVLKWVITNWTQNYIPLASLGWEFTFGPTDVFANCYEGVNVTLTQYQASLTIPPLANGIYRIGIYQSYNLEGQDYATLLCISQPLELDNFETFTQILEYGSAKDSIIEGFEYLNGWIQRIRVALNGAGQTYALEESIYRNSDGTFQKPQNSTDEIIYLHTDYFDLKTQRAMTSATRHPIFVLANQNLSVQGDLEIATNQDYTTNQSFRKLQQMRFQAKNQGYQPNNNSCLG